MRNIFDQYNHPENRLTHALVASLAADPVLLRRFITWVTGEKPSTTPLEIVEQALPGEEEPRDETEAERKGLPDGWIYDNSGWSLVIESKIESPLNRDQLERHRRTAERRGFTDIHLVALVTALRNKGSRIDNNVTVKCWTELYSWLLQQRKSEWIRRLTSYMEVLETKLVRDDYLRGGTLTVFAGIPFGKDQPYNYHEAKRLLRLAMDGLRKRSDLKRELRIDPKAKGRSAITGRESLRVWDFLRLETSRRAKTFTEFPHLTLSIQEEQLIAIITVPNGIRREFRNNLLAGGLKAFSGLFERILNNFHKTLGRVEGAAPWIEVIQRRYPAQRSEPIIDARLQFDLRTGFDSSRRGVKHQPQWVEATYEALINRNCNLQLGVGGIFRYDRCPAVRTPEILNHVADLWLACKPLLECMMTPA